MAPLGDTRHPPPNAVTGGWRRAAGGGAAGTAAVIGLMLVAVPVGSSPPSRAPTHGHYAQRAAGRSYAQETGARTLAGTGVPGFGGDGRNAVHARLDAPAGIAVDGKGDLFIADAGNCRVREVPASTGSSFAKPVHGGDIVTLVGGNCRSSRRRVVPTALAVDTAGDLFIASGSGSQVDELPVRSAHAFGARLTRGRLATIAGTGEPGYNGDGERADRAELDDPTGVAVDSAGDVLIADTANCRLRVVAAAGGARLGVTMQQGHIYTVAGDGVCGSAGDGGPARQAELWDPAALAMGPAGSVLVADQGSRTVRVLATRSGTYYGTAAAAGHLGTVAGEGSYGPYVIDGLPATGETAEINFPSALAVGAGGELFISDGAMHAIRVVPDTTTSLSGRSLQPGHMYTVAGALLTGPEHHGTSWIQTRMLDPAGLALASGGRLIYSDRGANVVRQLPAGT